LLPALKVPSGLRYALVSHWHLRIQSVMTYTLLGRGVVRLVLVSYVTTLGSEFLGQFGTLGECAVGVAVSVAAAAVRLYCGSAVR
jgi:hypothetical protein